MFRVAAGAPSLRLVLSGPTVEGIAVGRALVPTEADGGARVYFSRRHAGRFVSAVDVLEDRVDPERLRQKLVLVAVTGLGLGEYHATPVGERMPGSEIHAQLLENLYDGTLLSRPSWGPVLEAALFALLATLLIVATPAWAPRHALWVAVGGVAILLASGYAAFRTQRLLFDAATPSLALLLVFGALLVATLAEALKPAIVEWLNDDQLRFVLQEGKKRQIRRMCEAVGLKVIGLKRVRIGRVMLGDLPVGQWRYLRADEVFG